MRWIYTTLKTSKTISITKQMTQLIPVSVKWLERRQIMRQIFALRNNSKSWWNISYCVTLLLVPFSSDSCFIVLVADVPLSLMQQNDTVFHLVNLLIIQLNSSRTVPYPVYLLSNVLCKKTHWRNRHVSSERQIISINICSFIPNIEEPIEQFEKEKLLL